MKKLLLDPILTGFELSKRGELTDKYYSVNVLCGNCKYKNIIFVLKGRLVENQLCPACKCKTLGAINEEDI